MTHWLLSLPGPEGEGIRKAVSSEFTRREKTKAGYYDDYAGTRGGKELAPMHMELLADGEVVAAALAGKNPSGRHSCGSMPTAESPAKA
jgi:hypothetical protein